MTNPVGRPRHAPTKASRRRVVMAAAGGMPHGWIAEAEGISHPTLRRHYRVELTIGVRQELVKVRQALLKSAQKGNVSAAKFLAEHPPEDFGWPERKPAAAPPPIEPARAPEPLGKKAAADMAAKSAAAGTGWADLLDDSAPPQ